MRTFVVPSVNRLALGTVQFGLPYGVANVSGQVDLPGAVAILTSARAAGLDTLDTAVGYGESERRLGDVGIRNWRVVTKLPPLPTECEAVGAWVRTTVLQSLERLRVPRLAGLLLHRPSDLRGPFGRALHRALLDAREEGLVAKIGISIYEPAELDALWPQFEIDLIQAPFNVLDQRLLTSGWLERLADEGVEVHTRSIFLQGLLLMGAARPTKFDRWRDLWAQWDAWLEEGGISPVRACLAVGLARPEISRVVVGVDSAAQLDDILTAARDYASVPRPPIMSDDPDLLNPARWPAL